MRGKEEQKKCDRVRRRSRALKLSELVASRPAVDCEHGAVSRKAINEQRNQQIVDFADKQRREFYEDTLVGVHLMELLSDRFNGISDRDTFRREWDQFVLENQDNKNTVLELWDELLTLMVDIRRRFMACVKRSGRLVGGSYRCNP